LTKHAVPLGRFPTLTNLTILHLSDLHASAEVPLSWIRKTIARGLEAKPDLILLTGDYITDKIPSVDAYAACLAELSRKAPAYASLGNHDGGDWAAGAGGYVTTTNVERMLEQAGIVVLKNRGATVTIRGQRLRLVGLGDLWATQFRPKKAFAAQGERLPTLVLSHNPDTKGALLKYDWDLLLCGHTHGGQVVLPFLGAAAAPVEDKEFVRGLRRWNGRWVHITAGVGQVSAPRLNCPAEVCLIEIHGAPREPRE
jgi:predicted MPP superfamily phosphohydrolase